MILLGFRYCEKIKMKQIKILLNIFVYAIFTFLLFFIFIMYDVYAVQLPTTTGSETGTAVIPEFSTISSLMALIGAGIIIVEIKSKK